MKGHLTLPNNHLTVDDFFIWAGLAMQFEHLRYPFTRHALLPADRRDAELMYALADMKRHMPDSKAVAHRMLEGRFGVPESILIDGFWVALG